MTLIACGGATLIAVVIGLCALLDREKLQIPPFGGFHCCRQYPAAGSSRRRWWRAWLHDPWLAQDRLINTMFNGWSS